MHHENPQYDHQFHRDSKPSTGLVVDRPVSNHCPAFRTHQSDVRCAELAVGRRTMARVMNQ